MSDSPARELVGRLTESQAKYTYFLLAVAASIIALIVRQTQEARFQAEQIPLGLAVFCFGASFTCGCKFLSSLNDTLRANAAFLMLREGIHPDMPRHPQEIELAAKGVSDAAASHAQKTGTYSRWQFRLLILGAGFYLTWHVAGMWLRTA